VGAVPIRPRICEIAAHLSCIYGGSVSHLNSTHRPILANRDQIKRQMLAQEYRHSDAMRHQVGNYLPESLVAFVLRMMSHPTAAA
jgi:hypothetical protein